MASAGDGMPQVATLQAQHIVPYSSAKKLFWELVNPGKPGRPTSADFSFGLCFTIVVGLQNICDVTTSRTMTSVLAGVRNNG
jgi:hypothetical protein